MHAKRSTNEVNQLWHKVFFLSSKKLRLDWGPRRQVALIPQCIVKERSIKAFAMTCFHRIPTHLARVHGDSGIEIILEPGGKSKIHSITSDAPFEE